MLSQEFYKSDLSFLEISANSKQSAQTFEILRKTITQKQIIVQILYLLMGMPGSILTKKANSDQLQLSGRYQMSHLTSQTFKSTVKQYLKMINETKYVEEQASRLYKYSTNAVIRSFCQSVFNYLQGVKKYFADILGELNAFIEPIHCKITLISFTNLLEQRNYMLGFLIRCLNSCLIQYEKKSQLVRLLDKMEEIQKQILPYSEFIKSQLVKIFKRTLQIYLQNIKDWLNMKQICQSLDFFIHMQDNNSFMLNQKRSISEYFLHRNEEIQPTKLPKFIQNQSHGILQIGKTIRFISLYYADFEKQRLIQYLKINEQFKIIDQAIQVDQVITFQRVAVEKVSLNDRLNRKNKQGVNRKQIVHEQNPYQMFTKLTNTFNIKWIQKHKIKVIDLEQKAKDINSNSFFSHIKCLLIQILQAINKKCLHFFRDHNDTIMVTQRNRIQTSLFNTLLGIKKFMLFQQGDFIEQFFTAAEEIIDKQKGQISHNRIYSCIDQAIQNSSAKFISKDIISNLHFDFIKQSDKRSQRFKLWILFCFNYKQDNPINYIFTASMMDKLKQICNMIFKLKKGQLILTKIWDQDREIVKTDRMRLKVLKKAKILRNSLNTFLNICVSFLLNRIDIIWNDYNQKILQAPTVFQIVSQSVEVIANLQKCSTQNNLFYNGTMMSLGLVQKFRKLHQLIDDSNMIVPIKQVDQLEFELRSVCQIVMKIPELKQVINYNSYFDKYE